MCTCSVNASRHSKNGSTNNWSSSLAARASALADDCLVRGAQGTKKPARMGRISMRHQPARLGGQNLGVPSPDLAAVLPVADGGGLTLVLGAYGAIVSTLLAASQLLRDRPGVKLRLTPTNVEYAPETETDDALTRDFWEVRVVNHRKRPITIRRGGLLGDRGQHVNARIVDPYLISEGRPGWIEPSPRRSQTGPAFRSSLSSTSGAIATRWVPTSWMASTATSGSTRRHSRPAGATLNGRHDAGSKRRSGARRCSCASGDLGDGGAPGGNELVGGQRHGRSPSRSSSLGANSFCWSPVDVDALRHALYCLRHAQDQHLPR